MNRFAILCALALASSINFAAAQTPTPLSTGADAETEMLQQYVGTTYYTCASTPLVKAVGDSLTNIAGEPVRTTSQIGLTIKKIMVMKSDKSYAVHVLFGSLYGFVLQVFPVSAPFPIKSQLGPESLPVLLGTNLRLQPVSVNRGSTLDDLTCVQGRPQSVNDYDGNTQYVYNDGDLIYYVDNATEIVTNIQRFQTN